MHRVQPCCLLQPLAVLAALSYNHCLLSVLQTCDCDFLTIEFSVVFRAKSPTPYTRHLQPQSWLGGQEAAPNKRRCLEASLQRRAVGYGRYDLNLPGVSLEGGEAMGRSDESHI